MHVLFPSSCLLTGGVFILAPKIFYLTACKPFFLGQRLLNFSLRELDFETHRRLLFQLYFLYILNQKSVKLVMEFYRLTQNICTIFQ